MPLSNIVNVQISRETQSVSEQGFGTLLILGASKSFNDLYRIYSDMQEVAVDFLPYEKEYVAAQDVFAQPITPPSILIGRRTVDTADLLVETAMTNQNYTVSINGVDVTVDSNATGTDSTVNLSGSVSVLQFSSTFSSDNVCTVIVNDVTLPPISYPGTSAGMLLAIKNAIILQPGVSAGISISSSNQIKIQFSSEFNATINSCTTIGTSNPTCTITDIGPLTTSNLINVSLNGVIVGNVTSKISYSVPFSAGSSTATIVNGASAGAAIPYTTSNAGTLNAITAQLSALNTIFSSVTNDGVSVITATFLSAGNNTINSSITTGGGSAVATISEGGFSFSTDTLTTMNNIASAIVSVDPTHILTATVSGIENGTLSIVTTPNFNGIIDFFNISLGSFQAPVQIINSIQATLPQTISGNLVAAINSAGLGVVASPTTPTDGNFSITAQTPGVPYTLFTSTDISNPNKCRILINQAVPNLTYSVTINGIVFDYTSGNSVTNNEEVALGMVNLINATAGLVPVSASDNGNGTFEINSTTSASFRIQASPFTYVSIQKGIIIQPYVPSTNIVSDLNNIQAINNDWYALAVLDRYSPTVQAVAAWIETQIKIFGTASQDLNIINVPTGVDTTSIAAILNTHGYARSFVLFGEDADTDYPECAWFGKCLPFDPGSETWAFKTLNSIAYSNLSSTQENNAFSKNCNTYEYIGGVGITQKGTVAVGEYIDIIRGVDWLTSTIQSYVYNLLVNSQKVPYTDSGITAIESQVRRALQLGVENNFIAQNPAYQIFVPLASSVPSVDKANRILRNVKFQATLAGAIHAVVITGNVSV